VVGTGVAVAALTAVPMTPAAATGPRSSGAARRGAARNLPFTPIAPAAVTVDDVTVPVGYRWDPILRWGDPILAGAPAIDATAQSPEAQAGQFGYNNDYLDIIETNRAGTRALLVCNHEYTNENIMFPPGTPAETVIRTVWAAHGMSVVELERRSRGDVWTYVPGAGLNRRITLDTPFAVDGPAAGSDLLRTKEDPTGRTVRGTMNNCAGGTTPWGTVLSGEENFNQYFRATGTDPREARYGLSAT
jgi:secreted PhoX family phosphatase